ncbi:hypothetical protein [Legionella brunensis]|uniref:Methyltransferase domain-containing protein n=1 Tax=Legionella brunensis TaxID=29422 RepID=A0A0W0SMF4_9GAMM|nr:hypothetical protein [Legionella brunensis]KTC84494.1 hypothetical protein Lbru_1362 [Legionella brunensis]
MKEIDELINAIIESLHPLNKDDSFLHQLIDDSTGMTIHSVRSSMHATVKKIDIFTIPDFNKYPPQPLGSVVQITGTDGLVALFKLEPEKLKKLKPLLEQAKVYPESAFLRPRVPALIVSQFDNLQIYDEKTHKDYEIIRESIAKIVSAFMQKQSNTDVIVVDIGTGLGDCLELTAKMLLSIPKNVIAIGIDPNDKSIETAKLKFPNYIFSLAEAHFLEKIVKEVEQQNSNKNFLVAATASGSITRLVLNNTLEALEVFQQAYRVVDIMVLGGENEVLITRKNAKKIGWHAHYQPSQLEEGNLVYVLTEEKLHVPKVKDGHLNLSLHANPLLILSHCGDLTKITSIDLGLAYLKKDEVVQLLKLMPQLKKIQISGLEKWKTTIEKTINSHNLGITIFENSAAYIDTELEREKWELKKFSSKFYKQHSGILTFFNKSIVSLEKEAIAEKYKPGNQELSQSYIERLEILAHQEDDIAMYVLAKKLAEVTTSENFPNLQKSFKYWSTLYEKGYPVLFELEKVHQLVEKASPLQDLYAKLNEAFSKFKPNG